MEKRIFVTYLKIYFVNCHPICSYFVCVFFYSGTFCLILFVMRNLYMVSFNHHEYHGMTMHIMTERKCCNNYLTRFLQNSLAMTIFLNGRIDVNFKTNVL